MSKPWNDYKPTKISIKVPTFTATSTTAATTTIETSTVEAEIEKTFELLINCLTYENKNVSTGSTEIEINNKLLYINCLLLVIQLFFFIIIIIILLRIKLFNQFNKESRLNKRLNNLIEKG